jgi:hypothetical protein
MIDRNNWIAVREFLREHENHANALRRALRSERRRNGVITKIRNYVYDIIPKKSSSALRVEQASEFINPGMIVETAPDFRFRGGNPMGNVLIGVLK